jgi:large subunit ribosomal protein L34
MVKIKGGTKRKKRRKVGFLSRSKTKSGRRIILRRRRKGRKRI